VSDDKQTTYALLVGINRYASLNLLANDNKKLTDSQTVRQTIKDVSKEHLIALAQDSMRSYLSKLSEDTT
jgi:hypothetical protein